MIYAKKGSFNVKKLSFFGKKKKKNNSKTLQKNSLSLQCYNKTNIFYQKRYHEMRSSA